MATLANNSSADISTAQARPVALFLAGISDDGLARIVAEPPDFALRYRTFGCLNHYEHVKIPGLVNEVVMLLGEPAQKVQCSLPRVIVNCIVDADVASRSLAYARQFIAQLQANYHARIPVINAPTAIARTQRDKIYDAFKDLPGLRIPRTIRITPQSVAEMKAQANAAKMNPPFIIRGTGTHGGRDMQKIENWSAGEMLKLERYAYDGRAFYMTEWVDFKNKDGIYRKYRLVAVDDMLIARHMIASDQWKVHSQSRAALMQSRQDLCAQEQAFLKHYGKLLNKDALSSLAKIRAGLGLDYFGMDCSLREDGTLVVFEINAAFNTMVQEGLQQYPYLADPMRRVKQAFNAMVARQAAIKLAV